MATSSSGKVSFSLGSKKAKKKKDKQKSEVSSEDFGHDEPPGESTKEDHHDDHHRPKEPLVIPLMESKQGSLLLRKRPAQPSAEDEAATSALIQSATSDGAHKTQHEQSTDFSGSGKLVIPTTISSSAAPADNPDDAAHLRADLEGLPTELDPSIDNETYRKVPVLQFGAALLRGMGWKGDETSSGSSDTKDPVRRPHRLGLGATPKALDGDHNNRSLSGRIRTPNQAERERRLREQQEEFEQRRREHLLKDKQRTMQHGSIVRVNRTGSSSSSSRAKMIQLTGVPGLNRVKVQIEGETTTTVVPKSSVSLIDRTELDQSRPYDDVPLQEEAKTNPTKFHGAKGTGSDNTERDNKRRRRPDRDEDDDCKRSRDGRSKDPSRRRWGEEEDYENRKEKKKKRRKKESSRAQRNHLASSEHWIVPNIRVRVVTRKLGSRYFKEKGVVLDVTKRGDATLQMTDRSLLDKVAERHLETAHPKAGGKAIVLAPGMHQFRKGTLLERNSERCVVQMQEDMSVLTLPLDDIAEWMGALEE